MCNAKTRAASNSDTLSLCTHGIRAPTTLPNTTKLVITAVLVYRNRVTECGPAPRRGCCWRSARRRRFYPMGGRPFAATAATGLPVAASRLPSPPPPPPPPPSRYAVAAQLIRLCPGGETNNAHTNAGENAHGRRQTPPYTSARGRHTRGGPARAHGPRGTAFSFILAHALARKGVRVVYRRPNDKYIYIYIHARVRSFFIPSVSPRQPGQISSHLTAVYKKSHEYKYTNYRYKHV